jgi:uncharacterized protein YkwD
MSKHARFLGWMAVFATCLGGCPPVLQPDGGGYTPPADASGDTASGGETQTDQVVASDLTAQFPDCGEPAEEQAWQARILELVNQERTLAGLPALARNAILEAQATQYACEMIHYGFFAHVNPFTGTEVEDRADEFGYEWWMGENLAAGQPTPEAAFNAWMNSEGHRYNILHPQCTELGVGVRTGGEYGIYWVQEFGYPRP